MNERQSLKPLKNRRGFSLVEVMIAFGLMGFLALVMSSLFSDMFKAQKQTNVVNTIETMRMTIIKLVNDGSPWKNTALHVDNSAIFGCMTSLSCADSGASAVDAMTASAATLEGSPFMQLQRLQNGGTPGDTYIDNTSPTAGFTDRGSPCTTFNSNPASGDDACPIRWSIRVAYECSGASCANPVLRVIAILYYNPNPNNPMKSVINPIKYRVDLRRGSQGDVRSELVQAEYRGAGGASGGVCNDEAAGGTLIPFAEISDAGDNMSGSGTSLTFNPGTYSCSVSSSCFACESVRLELIVNGTVAASSISVAAPNWVAAQVNISQAVFTINAPSAVSVRQICSSQPGEPDVPGLANAGLGLVTPPYSTGTKFAEILCTRMF